MNKEKIPDSKIESHWDHAWFINEDIKSMTINDPKPVIIKPTEKFRMDEQTYQETIRRLIDNPGYEWREVLRNFDIPYVMRTEFEILSNRSINEAGKFFPVNTEPITEAEELSWRLQEVKVKLLMVIIAYFLIQIFGIHLDPSIFDVVMDLFK